MTPDIRTAAEDAMIRANAVEPLVVVDGEEAVMQLTEYGNGFIAGAVWAAARALEEFADQMTTGFNAGTLNAERRAIKREARARAEAYRQERGEQ